MTWWKQGVEYFFVSGLKTSQKLVAEAELWININKFFPLFCMLSSTLIKLKNPKCYEHQEKKLDHRTDAQNKPRSVHENISESFPHS